MVGCTMGKDDFKKLQVSNKDLQVHFMVFDFLFATFETSIAHSGIGGLMDVVWGLQKVVYGKTQQDHDYFYLRTILR